MTAAKDTIVSPEALAQTILNGSSFGSEFGLTERDEAAIYSVGCRHLDKGDEETAEKFFQALCLINHTSAQYWLALGLVQQRRKVYQNAVVSFSMAAQFDVDNPVAPMNAAQCYLALGFISEALDALDVAVEWAEKHPDADQFIEPIERLISKVEQPIEWLPRPTTHEQNTSHDALADREPSAIAADGGLKR